jgi:hypothetical protein
VILQSNALAGSTYRDATMGEYLRTPFTPRLFFLSLLILVLAVYFVDFTWYECRVLVPRLGGATGSVHRIRLLAIPSKVNKIEYQVDSLRPEEDMPCSHSLFPHGGNRPCWYVTKHANDPIPM